MSGEKNYYIFEYVYDSAEEEYTQIEGEIQGYVKATDPFDACKKAGFEDYNRYFAKPVEDLDSHTEAIKKERKHLSKVSKQLKGMIDERDQARKDFEENRPCPNCEEKMDEDFTCPKCGFGKELENLEL